MGILTWLVGTLVAGMKWLICAVIGAFLFWLKGMLVSALGALPDVWTEFLGTYAGFFYKWYRWGNQYVPLTEMLTLLFIYYSWCVVCSISAWSFRMLRG